VAARSLLGLAFAGFIALGLPEGSLGVAWPSIAGDRARRLGELGVLLALYTLGYLVSTVSNGRLMRRFGLGRMLPVSSGAAAMALGVYGAGGSWHLLVVATVLLGFAGGLIDAGVNAYAALKHGSRVMNLLHASFGLGATLGPLVMTLAIEAASWEAGYMLLAAIQAALALAFWWTRAYWDVSVEIVTRRALRGPDAVLLVSLLVFFLYTGVEVAVGQWAFTLFTEGRGFGIVAAGLLVTGYWGSFTVGRLITAAIGDRRHPETIVLGGMVAALGGTTLLWWEPGGWLGAVGLLATGLSLAPIFPLLTLLTPGRLGSEFAPTAIGYQLAAATVGAAVIPGSLGLGVEQFGVEWIGAGLVGWTAVLLGAGLVLAVLAGPHVPAGHPGAS
jgi:fucose permease